VTTLPTRRAIRRENLRRLLARNVWRPAPHERGFMYRYGWTLLLFALLTYLSGGRP